MSILILTFMAIAIFISLVVWGTKGHRAINRGLRKISAIDAVTAAYSEGDYETALRKSENLRTRLSKTAAYCFFRGSMLYHLGRFDEAEASLREGLLMEENPSQKALVYNTLASVFMEMGRYPEAITFFENAGRAWPDRGANHRGLAEVWLRQGREFPEALEHARQAVEIDRRAAGLKKEAIDSRLGEDLAVLAWAVAVNSGNASEVESLFAEAMALVGTKTKPTFAEVHYHAGRAYEALKITEKSRDHLRQAMEADPKGIWGSLAQSIGSPPQS